MMEKNKKILAVVAHPDDEVLGAGGTLCVHRDRGDSISILILANGEDSRGSVSDPEKRFSQARGVSDKLGAKLFLENFPDNKFDTVSLISLAQAVEKVIAEVKPDVVYTHHIDDLNVDHRLTCGAVLTACRPQPNFCVSEILSFEVLSCTEWQIKDHRVFKPNHYVDISKYVEEKKALMNFYGDELRKYPHPRSLEGIEILSKYRGIEVGLTGAEAFRVVRKIV